MSIYATIGTIKVPSNEFGEVLTKASNTADDFEWIEITIQGVPAHIGRADHYEDDPYDEYLPPALSEESELEYRAVLFVERGTPKAGDDYGPQQYHDVLLMLTGQEYAELSLHEILDRLHDNIDQESRGS